MLEPPRLTCLVCHEETEPAGTEYCRLHATAYDNLRHAFKAWTHGYGPLSLPDFLNRMQKLPETGEKTKEIARFIQANLSRWT